MRMLLVLLLSLSLGFAALAKDDGASGTWEVAPRALDGTGDGYVGDAACVECHKEAHALWSTSSHANTYMPVNEDNLPAEVVAEEVAKHPPGESRFRKQGDGWQVQTIGDSGKPEWFDLTHVIGRMRVRMYLAQMDDGRLQVLPGKLEEPTGRWFDYTKLLFGGPGSDWDTPPIVGPKDGSFWTGPIRAWDAKCARCHTSGHVGVAPQEDEIGLRGKQRRLGVDCEMCHGPSAEHIAHHREKRQGIDPITRWHTLARSQQVSACLRCHMESEIDDPDFVLGDDIFEHVTPTLMLSPERIDPYGRVLELIYDGLPFSASRCAEEGGLTCVTCHDPHGSGHRSQMKLPADDDRMCTTCHEEIGAEIEKHTHHPADSSGSRCVACHMPFLKIERGHGVVADHSISIPRIGLPGDRVAQDACTWCHSNDVWAPDDVRMIDTPALKTAYDEWWPEARGPDAWMQALANARLGKEDAAPPLVAVTRDTSMPRVVRASAARLLSRYGKDASLALMMLTGDDDSLVRRSAFTALGATSGDAIDRLLMRGLKDPVASVRAASAIAALEGWTRVQKNRALLEAALPVLQAHAEADPGQEDRWFRLGAARQLAGDVKGAIEAYERYVRLYPAATIVQQQIENLRKGR
ncbi:MAG: HEAT repeat domain-containing protein [Planctomycetota bacterium]|nr:HEAT repeat domain-containing protein [Planctomycetota bacterium]